MTGEASQTCCFLYPNTSYLYLLFFLCLCGHNAVFLCDLLLPINGSISGTAWNPQQPCALLLYASAPRSSPKIHRVCLTDAYHLYQKSSPSTRHVVNHSVTTLQAKELYREPLYHRQIRQTELHNKSSTDSKQQPHELPCSHLLV